MPIAFAKSGKIEIHRMTLKRIVPTKGIAAVRLRYARMMAKAGAPVQSE